MGLFDNDSISEESRAERRKKRNLSHSAWTAITKCHGPGGSNKTLISHGFWELGNSNIEVLARKVSL